MAKKSKEEVEGKEWRNMLGSATFKRLENGRFKCVQTGHEVPSQGRDSYGQSKHCRVGLIDSALSKNKTPLNMFHQDPLSRLKLICKLTGDIVNKSEEHIWKHIHGKRFLNELEKKEAEELTPNRNVEEPSDQTQEKISKPKAEGGLKKKKKKKQQEQNVGELIFEGDRWDSGSESGLETEDADGAGGATDLLSIPEDCQERIWELVRHPVHIDNLLTKGGGRKTFLQNPVLCSAPLLTSPLQEMAPKKDLALIKAREQEAAARAAGRKRKRQAAAEEDNQSLRRLRHGVRKDQAGPSTPAVEVASPQAAIPTGIPLASPRPVTVSLDSPEPTARERVRSSLLLSDIQKFRKATPTELLNWGYSFTDSVGCVMDGLEFHLAELAKKAAEAESALKTERERSAQEMAALIASKDEEIKAAEAERLGALADASDARDALREAQEKAKAAEDAAKAAETARDEAEKAADAEFDTGFFEGYSDLKRRVALDHPEWDLSGFIGSESDYWELGASDAEEALPTGEAAEEVGETEVVVVDDDPPT